MPAFSLYLTSDRETYMKEEAARLGISAAKFVSLLIDSYRRKAKAQLALVGADGLSWTDSLQVTEAVRSRNQAKDMHPQLAVYLLPEGVTVKRGDPIPEGSVIYEGE